MMLVSSYCDHSSIFIHIVNKNEGTHMYSTHVLHRTLQALELLRIFQYLIYLLRDRFKLNQILLSKLLEYSVYFFNHF